MSLNLLNLCATIPHYGIVVDEEYKLAEWKPDVWNRIAGAMNCDRGKTLLYVVST